MDNSFFDELNKLTVIDGIDDFFDEGEVSNNNIDENVYNENISDLFSEPDKPRVNQSDISDDSELSKVKAPYEEAKAKLENAKKTNIFGKSKRNSEQYSDVLDGVDNIISTIESLDTPSNNEHLVVAADSLAGEMRTLIETGNIYMRKTGGFFSEGKARKRIVGSLIAQLQSDAYCLEIGANSYDYRKHNSDFAGFSWYRFMREQSVDLGNVNYATLNDIEGEYSGVKQLNEEVDTFGGSYFKEDMNVYRNENSNLYGAFKIANELSDKSDYPLTEQEKNMLRLSKTFDYSDVVSQSPSIVLFKKYYQNAMEFEKRNYKKASEAKNDFFQKDENEQAFTNLNNREVAAYKIALILGQPSLLARAQRAVVKSNAPGDETTKTGTIVENVQGTNASLSGLGILQEEIERFKQLGLGSLEAYGKSYDRLYNTVSGSFIKSILNLQVLDYICNVPERKLDDMVVQEDSENKVVSVTGINSTTAFGAEKSTNGVLSSKGALNLAYMDRNLADAIKVVTKEMLVYLLKDLISDSEIAGTWDRINRLKTAIQKQEELDPTAFITLDIEWENNKQDIIARNTKDNSNYFAKYANSKTDIKSDEATRRIGMNLAQDWIGNHTNVTKQQWNEELREVCEEGLSKAEFEAMLDKYDLMPWFSPKGIMDEKYVKDAISLSLKKEFIGKLATALFNCRIKNNANA